MLAIVATATTARAQEVPLIALVDVTVIDEVSQMPRPHSTVIIEGERITSIFPAGSRSLPAGTTELALAGRFVLPGLIDTHVHLATDPDGEDARPRAERRLRIALLGGVTTVRDMAGDTRALASLARDARVGTIDAPDIFFAALFAGPRFFADPRTQSSARGAVAGNVPWMRAITPDTDLRQVVAEARGTGATGIKLYAALDSSLTRRITEEAHRQGFRVWAHASLNPATPIDVARAGVDVLSHASLLRGAMSRDAARSALQSAREGQVPDVASPGLDEVFSVLARRGALFEPTLFVDSGDPARLAFSAAITRRARRAGVVLTAGTDSIAGVDDVLPNLHAEMELLVEKAGLTPAEALRAATRNAAIAIGIADTLGTVEAGKLADLLVLRSDPLRDIRNTRDIELVIKRGKLYRRE
jgi:imidazolonepropionase-like amidohydrolase